MQLSATAYFRGNEYIKIKRASERASRFVYRLQMKIQVLSFKIMDFSVRVFRGERGLSHTVFSTYIFDLSFSSNPYPASLLSPCAMSWRYCFLPCLLGSMVLFSGGWTVPPRRCSSPPRPWLCVLFLSSLSLSRTARSLRHLVVPLCPSRGAAVSSQREALWGSEQLRRGGAMTLTSI